MGYREYPSSELIAKVVTSAINSEEGYSLYPIFLELAKMEKSQYSYRNTLVAETEGKAIGAIVGYDGAKLHELRKPIFELIQQQMGKTLEIEDETSAGEFYLDSLSVLPEFRGLGIGTKLLSAMIDLAHSLGHDYVGLLVDFENPKAEKLYHKMGFQRVNPTTFLGHKMWHLQLSTSPKQLL